MADQFLPVRQWGAGHSRAGTPEVKPEFKTEPKQEEDSAVKAEPMQIEQAVQDIKHEPEQPTHQREAPGQGLPPAPVSTGIATCSIRILVLGQQAPTWGCVRIVSHGIRNLSSSPHEDIFCQLQALPT